MSDSRCSHVIMLAYETIVEKPKVVCETDNKIKFHSRINHKTCHLPSLKCFQIFFLSCLIFCGIVAYITGNAL